MANSAPSASVPTAFISYSWDDEAHIRWVKEYASRLRQEQGSTSHSTVGTPFQGDQLPAFMERAARENDFVLIICTQRYRAKSNDRTGGVGYEGDIMTAEVFTSGNQRKFIPILRVGEITESAPSWLLGKFYLDQRGDPYSEHDYEVLLRTLHGASEEPPPLGPRPVFLPAASAHERTRSNGINDQPPRDSRVGVGSKITSLAKPGKVILEAIKLRKWVYRRPFWWEFLAFALLAAGLIFLLQPEQ